MTLNKQSLIAALETAMDNAASYVGCRCDVDDVSPGDCWPCRMVSVVYDIEEALSLAQQLDENVELIARVKELEDKALTLGDIHEAHIIIIKQLERKLEVARDAVRNIIDGDLPNIWQFTSEIEPEVLEYINTLVESIDKLYEALTATDTIQKITVIKEGSIVFEDGRFEMRDWDINANGAAFTQQEYLALVLEYLAAKARGQDTTQKEAGEG